MPLQNLTRYTAAALTMLVATSSYAAEPIANAGTLTCTLSPAKKLPSQARTQAPVSCHFNAISGKDFSLSGRIVRLAAKEVRSAKIVISWSVLAPIPDIDPQALSGRFTGTIPDADGLKSAANPPVGTLFGTARSGIELRPMDVNPETLPDAGLTVLELDIVFVKV